ncbi:sodium/potassium/calcium exchanger 2 [Elysia marginata]|uniref:Sodium/potassium/calcium exchanger 2 n=1 Tax=Elysia marginata TaxID=1093978 RepID=A0AAV4I5L5_9GAST|nr:sodium/potassium/calcium exchanger 2 [Elysia marginata]
MPGELIKYGADTLAKVICNILNRVFSEHDDIDINGGKVITLQKPGKAKGPVINLRPITLLPVPWMLYSAVNAGDAYVVSSDGLLCSIFLLFIMLIAVIVCIAVSGWKMSKILGLAMMGLYLVFVTLAVLLEYGKIVCPKL